MSRRHLLKRQKGYKDINVALLDTTAPLQQPTAGSRSSPCRRSKNNVRESSLDTEDHGMADIRSNCRKTSTMQHKHQIILPCLLTSETNGPRKLPIGLVLNSDTATTTSVPGATWQKTPLITYSYMGHRSKVKSTTGKNSSGHTSRPYDPMDPTHPSRGRTESNNRLRVMMKEESFCSSDLGSNDRSTKTRCTNCLKSQQTTAIQQQQHAHRHKEGWYQPYLYNPHEDHEKIVNVNETHEYQCPPLLLLEEEPDYYYCDDELTRYDPTTPTDRLSTELSDLDDSGASHSLATTVILTDSSLGQPTDDDVVTTTKTTMINIGDGTMLRLRGADETWRAVENDYYTPTVCICCETTLFCISDADYFICPGCRVISPLTNNPDDQMPHSSNGGGVGLGFTMDELFVWQEEMITTTTSTRRIANH